MSFVVISAKIQLGEQNCFSTSDYNTYDAVIKWSTYPGGMYTTKPNVAEYCTAFNIHYLFSASHIRSCQYYICFNWNLGT